MARATHLAIALAGAVTAFAPGAAEARSVVDATPPQALSVTIYRDPTRGEDQSMNRDFPKGFAMVSEERTVTLPPGESTIRFDGVAEGMVAVSAIVTGLPGGTIEKNRNAELLSPAALVNGALGNRVRITRTNPASGEATSEDAIVRTRADGGLVLQSSAGYEAVRCAGLPEKLTFDRIPGGLSPNPVFSIDTRDEAGGTYRVTLTYIAWGFDWQAHYVARLDEGGGGEDRRIGLVSWLTLLNDNGQSFDDAQLQVIAGTLNVTSDYQALSDPPVAAPLRLTCYPIGSTARGSPIPRYDPVPPPPPPPPAPMMEYADSDRIIVTAARRTGGLMNAPVMMKAVEEQLGDLKLYRVPEPVSVKAQGLKQVAFLDKDAVKGRFLYETSCSPWQYGEEESPAAMLFETVNDKEHGLGVALPSGGVTVFEPSSFGDLLVAEDRLRDHAEGQDVELELGESSEVFAACQLSGDQAFDGSSGEWRTLSTRIANANRHPVRMRIALGGVTEWEVRRNRAMRIKDGELVYEVEVPAGSERTFSWKIRSVDAE